MIPTRSPRSPRSLTALWLALALALAAMAGPSTAVGAQVMVIGTSTPLPGPIAVPSGHDPVPAAVSPGAHVAFDVFFDNIDTSNISQLFLSAATPKIGDLTGTLVRIESTNRSGACNTDNNTLTCAFGALTPDDPAIRMRVVYLTPEAPGNFDVHFLFTTTGVSGDKKKKSHGDDYDVFTHVVLDDDDDFAGGYVLTTGQVTDVQDLSRRNPQWTAVNPPQADIPVLVGEFSGTLFTCPGTSASSCFGQWSFVGVANGTVFPAGFAVELGYDANKPDVSFVHFFDSGHEAVEGDLFDPVSGLYYELITETCSDASPDPSEMPCKTVDTAGGDTFVTLWLQENGWVKGI
jgi:hypothetical protein